MEGPQEDGVFVRNKRRVFCGVSVALLMLSGTGAEVCKGGMFASLARFISSIAVGGALDIKKSRRQIVYTRRFYVSLAEKNAGGMTTTKWQRQQ